MIRPLIQPPAVLEFEAVTLVRPDSGSPIVQDMSLALQRGESAVVRLEAPDQARSITQACLGLEPVRSGCVRFQGHDWSTLSTDLAHSLRGRMGQLVNAGTWIRHLTVLENLVLPQMHHRHGIESDIRSGVVQWCQAFGLPGAPIQRPAMTSAADLQCAACARAFIGAPELVIIEEPSGELLDQLLAPLINACLQVCQQGGAVLWLSAQRRVWTTLAELVTRRARISSQQFLETHS